jgi:hypothetical protein
MCLLGSDDVGSLVTVFEEKGEVSEINVNDVASLSSDGEVPSASSSFNAFDCGKNSEVPYVSFVNPDSSDFEMMPLLSDSEDECMNDEPVEGVPFVIFRESVYIHSLFKLNVIIQGYLIVENCNSCQNLWLKLMRTSAE